MTEQQRQRKTFIEIDDARKFPKEAALRYNKGKVPLSFILDFNNAIKAVSQVSKMGAEKYALLNWQKGLPWRSVEDSLLRHLTAFHNGENFDEESGLPHIAHVAWNALALCEFYFIREEFDDRKGEVKNG